MTIRCRIALFVSRKFLGWAWLDEDETVKVQDLLQKLFLICGSVLQYSSLISEFGFCVLDSGLSMSSTHATQVLQPFGTTKTSRDFEFSSMKYADGHLMDSKSYTESLEAYFVRIFKNK